MRIKGRNRFTLLLLFVPLVGVPLWCTSCGKTPSPEPLLFNFHVLEEGKAYRSSHISPEGLAYVFDKYDIRTVINLRGDNSGKPWYDDQAAMCAEKGVTLLDFAWNTQRLPEPDLLAATVEALQTAEYPIMIHCQAGADRTGAVSAIYRMIIQNHDRQEALAELSPNYWHFRAVTPCMDTIAEIYEPGEQWLDWYRREIDQIICTTEPVTNSTTP